MGYSIKNDLGDVNGMGRLKTEKLEGSDGSERSGFQLQCEEGQCSC